MRKVGLSESVLDSSPEPVEKIHNHHRIINHYQLSVKYLIC